MDRVSKYITLKTDSRTGLGDNDGYRRKVLMSLPRVKWLERDAPPSPPKKKLARDYMPPAPELPRTPETSRWAKANLMSSRARGEDGLTAREREVKHLTEHGLTSVQIAAELRIRPSTVNKIICRLEKRNDVV
jgi:DNA-binding CsgD family transcriptional regulator